MPLNTYGWKLHSAQKPTFIFGFFNIFAKFYDKIFTKEERKYFLYLIYIYIYTYFLNLKFSCQYH